MTPDECVSEMRQKIHEETMLTASAGIAPNRVRHCHWRSEIYRACADYRRADVGEGELELSGHSEQDINRGRRFVRIG